MKSDICHINFESASSYFKTSSFEDFEVVLKLGDQPTIIREIPLRKEQVP
jgi:hypothetical protein